MLKHLRICRDHGEGRFRLMARVPHKLALLGKRFTNRAQQPAYLHYRKHT